MNLRGIVISKKLYATVRSVAFPPEGALTPDGPQRLEQA